MKQFLFLLSILIITSCNDPKPANKLEADLDKIFKKEFSSDEPGGCMLVKKNGKTVFLKSYGLADLETKVAITENTIFNTGSISKTFVSNGILILNEKNLLSLKDPLSKYFNDFSNKELAGKVRIKHLLSHTSGLPDLREVSNNPEFYLTAKDAENFEPLKKAEQLNFEPGAQFQYSNPAYNGLALIIESLSNQAWQAFINVNIFKPSGMMNSKITNGSYPESGVAHAYDFDGEKYVENDYGEFPTFTAAGNGGVWSTVLDLAKYEDAIQKNIFLNEELIQESRTVFRPKSWADTLNPYIGYSWFIGEESLFRDQETNFGVKMVYHTGSQGGFRAFYITIPEKDILFIGLFNRPINEFRQLIFDSMMLFEKNNWME
jgi:CubicO group peptidase (beta-lactamase class C family)